MNRFRHQALFSTYSIVARDPDTGQFGVAVQTHQMCVGRIVPWLLPGRGAMATQSLANVGFGPLTLAMLREGVPAPRIVAALVASDPGESQRQVAVVDTHGRAAAHTGSACIREAGHHVGDGYSVQANMMTRTTVIEAMRRAYEQTQGDLAARMLAALQAAQDEDGDIRGVQSAALKIVPGRANAPQWTSDYDLRVDEHEQPLTELARLVRLVRARRLDDAGYELLEAGDSAGAESHWAEARTMAPELEELAFWQAVELADKLPHPQALQTAAHILHAALAGHERRTHWLDLIGRLVECGLIQRAKAGPELIAAFEEVGAS